MPRTSTLQGRAGDVGVAHDVQKEVESETMEMCACFICLFFLRACSIVCFPTNIYIQFDYALKVRVLFLFFYVGGMSEFVMR